MRFGLWYGLVLWRAIRRGSGPGQRQHEYHEQRLSFKDTSRGAEAGHHAGSLDAVANGHADRFPGGGTPRGDDFLLP